MKQKAHTLVLLPELAFGALQTLFAQAGWQTAVQSQAPLVPGEPESARFELGEAYAVYTFNPVCGLRVLDTSKAGVALPAALPLASSGHARHWLDSADERTQLRGILAAPLLGDAALAPRVAGLCGHARGALAQAAQRALQAMVPPHGVDAAEERDVVPRAEALAAIDLLREALAPLLHALARDHDGSLAASLQPTAADFALAFVPHAVERARAAYAASALKGAARVTSVDAGSVLQVALAPAGMLADDNMLSRQFPAGYQGIAELLVPERVWARWKYLRRGETSGMAYDGLVWLNERWVWFPKPYRVLSA
ncbi:MAG: hypothetical protein ACJ8GW_01685 [Massilia sp.]